MARPIQIWQWRNLAHRAKERAEIMRPVERRVESSPGLCPCMQCIISSLHAPHFGDKVLKLEWDLKKKNHKSQLFLARVSRDHFLFTLAKNNSDSSFLCLRSHSTSKTSSPKVGAWRNETLCCLQGQCQGLVESPPPELQPRPPFQWDHRRTTWKF